MALFLGMEREVLIVDPGDPQASRTCLQGASIACLATDPRDPATVYCGTDDRGLVKSTDQGESWQAVDGIDEPSVLSVAVIPPSWDEAASTVFAGSEPSRLYRSDDGGDTWRELTALQDLPSKPSWSFPPKPDTNHVRWITPHPTEVGTVFVAIEAGALIVTTDGGKTWHDRVDGGPFDSHTVHIHEQIPNRILSAAGDGFLQSEDAGQTWTHEETGLPWTYCWGLAVDAADPDLAVMSIAPGPGAGHGRQANAQAAIVRRVGNGGWRVIGNGLPEPHGCTLSVLANDPVHPGYFYALNNIGLYRSADGGESWSGIDVPWKREYLDSRPAAIAGTID